MNDSDTNDDDKKNVDAGFEDGKSLSIFTGRVMYRYSAQSVASALATISSWGDKPDALRWERQPANLSSSPLH